MPQIRKLYQPGHFPKAKVLPTFNSNFGKGIMEKSVYTTLPCGGKTLPGIKKYLLSHAGGLTRQEVCAVGFEANPSQTNMSVKPPNF